MEITIDVPSHENQGVFTIYLNWIEVYHKSTQFPHKLTWIHLSCCDHQYQNLQRSSQLVSTSNKRSSSGEMKIDLKRVVLYREMDLTLVVIKDELWSSIFTPSMEVDWSVISVIYWCEETCSIKPDMCECVITPRGEFGDEGMTLLNSCLGVKEPACFEFWTKKLSSVGSWHYRLELSIWVYVDEDVVWKSQYYWIGLDLGLVFVMLEQPHLQIPGLVIEVPHEGVWVLHWWAGQSSEGLTFYQYFCWDLGPTFECLWPPLPL